MKIKKNKIVTFIICFLVICINTISLSKYNNDLECNESLKVAKPIINVVKNTKIETEIFENSPNIEYDFLINNYNESEINEVPLYYTIEISPSVTNFPIKYKLVDVKKNKIVQLTNGKTGNIKLKSNEKQDDRYKIIVNWNEISGELAESVKINLKVNAIQ